LNFASAGCAIDAQFGLLLQQSPGKLVHPCAGVSGHEVWSGLTGEVAHPPQVEADEFP
jgi:hypothetical protein